MFTLQVLASGSPATPVSATAFPFRIGRSALSSLRLDAPGVWDNHASIELDTGARLFKITALGDAVLFVNGARVSESLLHNGALLDVGSCRLLFSLAPARQTGLVSREAFTWAILIVVMLLEAALVFVLN